MAAKQLQSQHMRVSRGWVSGLSVLLTCLSCLHHVEAGGGSGLLLGLSKDGKLGSSDGTDWSILFLCMGIGAAVIFGGALIHYLWTRHKKKKKQEAAADIEKARQAANVGARRPGSEQVSTGHTPPPPYTSVVADVEDE